MHLEGDASGAAENALLEIWAPANGAQAPQVSGASSVEILPRPAGYLIQAQVNGLYTVDLQ
jgi:hypothetical protein